MPNWCNNKLVLKHDSFDMLAEFCDAFNNDKTCEHYLPQPEDIGDGWFDWRVENWGTKWDFGVEDHGLRKVTINSDKTVSVSFSTAWAPPIGLYEELTRRGFAVDAMYFEPGMCFYGFFDGDGDNCQTFDDLDDIPESIVDAFSLADWIDDVKAERECEDRESEGEGGGDEGGGVAAREG